MRCIQCCIFKRALLSAAKPLNDYLGNGNPRALMLFDQQSRRVDLYFQQIALARFANGQ